MLDLKRKTRLLAIALLGMFAAGCATGPAGPFAGGGTSSVGVSAQQQGTVRAVFYRLADSDGQPVGVHAPVNLYINGHYQATLVGNSYTEAFLCPGQVRLAARDYDVYQRYETKNGGEMHAVAAAPATQYFEVFNNASGGIAIRGAGVPAITSLKLQDKTISRVVVSACNAG